MRLVSKIVPVEFLFLLHLVILYIFTCYQPEEVEYVLNFESPIYAFGEESVDFVDTSAISVERYNESTAFMHGNVVLLKGLENQAIVSL